MFLSKKEKLKRLEHELNLATIEKVSWENLVPDSIYQLDRRTEVFQKQAQAQENMRRFLDKNPEL